MAEKLSKQQRLDQARAAAKLAREERERRARRRRWLVPTASALGIVLIVIVVIVVVLAQPKQTAAAVAGPGNMASDGVAFEGTGGQLSVVKTAGLKAGESPTPTAWPSGDTRKHVVIVTDLGCPYCKLFEQAQAETLVSMVKAGKITLEIHPIGYLDANFTTNYPSRAANALALVAQEQPEHYFDAYTALYAAQPEERSAGLTDAQIISTFHGAGVSSSSVDDGIRDGTFLKWVSAATTRTLSNSAYWPSGSDKFSGTPSVFVDGKYFTFTKGDFSDLITALS